MTKMAKSKIWVLATAAATCVWGNLAPSPAGAVPAMAIALSACICQPGPEEVARPTLPPTVWCPVAPLLGLAAPTGAPAALCVWHGGTTRGGRPSEAVPCPGVPALGPPRLATCAAVLNCNLGCAAVLICNFEATFVVFSHVLAPPLSSRRSEVSCQCHMYARSDGTLICSNTLPE